MSFTDTITFNECEDIKCIQANVSVEGEGHILRVPVYLYDVCPCRNMIVGVCVYVKGRLYAIKTKKVFTGEHSCCSRICEFYAGDFFFLFEDTCYNDIRTRIITHYIY